MKKSLLLLAVLSAASFCFAGGEACTDKSKCDDKAKESCCCCKESKTCSKDAKACDKKADAKAPTQDAAKK